MAIFPLLALGLGAGAAFWMASKSLRCAQKEELCRIRDAGPEAMRNPPRGWDGVDEASDQSFPASDPPPHP